MTISSIEFSLPQARRCVCCGWLACVALIGLMTACGDGNDGNESDVRDVTIDRPTNPGARWETVVVDADDVGLHPSLDIASDGTVGIAYWAMTGYQDGTCDELGVDPPPPRNRWSLKYASTQGESWNLEAVAEPVMLGEPPGLSFAMAPDGTPSMAVISGEPVAQILYCGASDVGYLQRASAGVWNLDTAVTTSGEAASGLPASDYGDVVGYWPALAYDPTGAPVIAYRDVHSGGMQSDDLRRADLEMAWGGGGGGWSAIPVDMSSGAGTYNSLDFDLDGNPIVAYYTPTEDLTAAKLGIWAARSVDHGATWEKVQLFNQGTSEGPDVVVHPETGVVYVAFYASTVGFPQVATWTDPTAFTSSADGWELVDIGDSIFDEGYTPSIAVSARGNVAVAYYRCGRIIAGLGECTPDADALIFAWEDAGTWKREVVDEGTDEGFCGGQPSLAFDASGAAVIAYRCEHQVDGVVTSTLKVARREPM